MMTWVEKQAGTRSRRLSFRRVTRDAGEGMVSAMTGLILSQTCETEGCWGLESSVHTIFPAQDSQTSANSLKCTKQKNFLSMQYFWEDVWWFPMFLLCPAGSGSVWLDSASVRSAPVQQFACWDYWFYEIIPLWPWKVLIFHDANNQNATQDVNW